MRGGRLNSAELRLQKLKVEISRKLTSSNKDQWSSPYVNGAQVAFQMRLRWEEGGG